MASIYNVYIADGFVDDCDDLIHKCSQINTLSYEKFCDIWKEMHFGAIFHYRSSSAELAELSEEVIHIAKRYMIRNSINFEETVAGLFLVYGLLNLQPFPNFASIRFVPDDVPALDRLELEARRTRRQDVLYILGAVLIRGPSQYHVMERERGIEFPIRKYLEGMTTIDNQGVRTKGVFLRQNEELDIIRELGRLNKLYKDAKAALGVSDKSLKYVDENFATELDTSLKRVIGGSIDNKSDGDEETDDENEEHSFPSQDDVHTIKYKAMNSSVLPMKHLMGVEERKKSPKKAYKNLKKEKSPQKGQANSPKKKRQQVFKSRRKGKRKKNVQEDSDSEDDMGYLMLADDDDDEDNDVGDDDDNFEGELPKEVDCNMEIEIQSLPIIDNINNETGYEIEFIDYQNSNKSNLTDEVNEKSSKCKILKHKETTNNEDISPGDVDKSTACDNDKFKKPVLNDIMRKRLEKRDQKKPRLQTKFQRMGMLPVANFKEKKKVNVKQEQ